MTEERLNEFLRLWKPRLGLQLWDIDLVVESCDSEFSFMEIHRSRAYNAAKILVQPWVLTGEIPEKVIDLELTDKRVESMVVHELLHCTTSRLKGMVEDHLEGLLHRDVLELFVSLFTDQEENIIQNLAGALVQAFSAD